MSAFLPQSLALLSATGAVAAWKFLPSTEGLIATGVLGAASLGLAVNQGSGGDSGQGPLVLRLAGLAWTEDQFCQNFFLSGGVGSGKTVAIYNLIHGLNQRVHNWGGLWLDNKGNSHVDLLALMTAVARERDVIVCRARTVADGKATHFYNPLIDPAFNADQLGELLASTLVTSSSERNSAFFKQQAATHVARGIEALKVLGKPVTFRNLHEFLTSTTDCEHLITQLENVKGEKTAEAREIAHHFTARFVSRTGDQLSGTLSTCENILAPFLPPPIAEVFGSDQANTFQMADIERGKILCLGLPQTLPKSCHAVNTILKQLFYAYVMSRYERRTAKAKENLLVCVLDEAQHSFRGGEYGDHRYLDRMRDAKAAVIAAMQDHTSIYPVVDKDVATVLLLQFRTRFVFSAASQESAEISANFLGKREKQKRSHGYSGGRASVNYTPEDQYLIKPHEFIQLRPYHCHILHAAKTFRRDVRLPRVDPAQGFLAA